MSLWADIWRFATVTLLSISFIGLARGWFDRWPHLTRKGRRQYTAYFLLTGVLTITTLYRAFHPIPLVWTGYLFGVTCLILAVTSNLTLDGDEDLVTKEDIK